MPDNGAVYQPTTVGYSYESGRGDVSGGRIRSSFSRIMSRHKLSTKKWFEWVLLSVAICVFFAGLVTIILDLAYVDDEGALRKVNENESITKDENSDGHGKGSMAIGAAIMLFGLLIGVVWVSLKFVRRTKSPRSGIANSGGQYGPVLTELPSQTKLKPMNPHAEAPSSMPLSDQEEETRTLMQDSSSPQAASGPAAIIDGLPG